MENLSEWDLKLLHFLLTLNQRVQGSSPCAPTNKNQSLRQKISLQPNSKKLSGQHPGQQIADFAECQSSHAKLGRALPANGARDQPAAALQDRTDDDDRRYHHRLELLPMRKEAR